MRKSLWIFLLAVLIPSAVLGWLALRSAEEQKIILEQRTAELYQRETENLAAAARTVVDDQRRAFAETVKTLLMERPVAEVARSFSTDLAANWPRQATGFSISSDGMLCSPSPRVSTNSPEIKKFLADQGSFLSNKNAADVYTVPVDELTQPEVVRKLKTAASQNEYAAKGASPKSESSYSRLRANEASKQQILTEKEKAMPRAQASRAMQEDKKPQDSPFKSAPAAAGGSLPSKRGFVSDADTAVPAAPAPTSKPAPVALEVPVPNDKVAALQLQKSPVQAPLPEPSSNIQAQDVQSQAQLAEAAPAYETKGRARAWNSPDQQQQVLLQQDKQLRNVQPQQQAYDIKDRTAWSNLSPETAEFRALSSQSDEGILSRFVQDRLTVIFWMRPPQAPDYIFGCAIDAANLGDLWNTVMPTPTHSAQYVLALLDDKARPIATSPESVVGRDWKRPFVASEIGEALPHWEAALYLMRPEQLKESANGLRRTLVFLVVGMLGAIVLGSWLVVADARRQLALAQQKTDFVSNVSHELKTPLTSIRMFAELMLGGRAETQQKAPQYLRIIMVEAERLTRLINNVLDFAKLERRQKRFEKRPFDLHEMIDRIWESHELHLQESGFTTRWQAATPPYPVVGDEDALAQILVNLLSNAEKYSGDRKEIELQSYFDDYHVCVTVLDRGMGVPPGEERKIFEAFYRAHDSLSSGIQGSGLGLTLAQRLAHEHGGSIEYRAREGGGSAFTLTLPVAKKSESPSASPVPSY